jgi:catechol 2,3-dioxygenase-like lactoylglutathione lyase family enzyme
MAETMLEHVNITVSDPMQTAQRLCALFGWHIRWQGESIHNGFSVHVGADNSYVALYSRGQPAEPAALDSYSTRGGLNHIGVVVEDLDAAEARVRAVGCRPHKHADYEPGRRFYFDDEDGIEFEVVSYAPRRG